MDNMGVLERIANALERIATCLEKQNSTQTQPIGNIIAPPTGNATDTPIESTTDTSIGNPTDTLGSDNDNLVPTKSSQQVVIDYLASKDILVKTIPEESEANEVLDKISANMGKNYTRIEDVYLRLKRTLNTGRGIRLDMKNWTQIEINDTVQFCQKLYHCALLSKFEYKKSPQFMLTATINRIPETINFLTGHWLERFVKTSVEEILKNEVETNNIKIEYSYLINPQITLPNGDDFELDVLFQINGQPLWIEAKTGEYQSYVAKYSKMSDIMNIEPQHSLMVLTQTDDITANHLSAMFRMNVIPITSFVEKVTSIIKQMLQA